MYFLFVVVLFMGQPNVLQSTFSFDTKDACEAAAPEKVEAYKKAIAEKGVEITVVSADCLTEDEAVEKFSGEDK